MTETYYDVLGVDPDADEAEIESAYRSLIHEWHPDVSDHPDARERFLLIKEAREVLTDDAERKRYDRVGHAEYTGDGTTGSQANADAEREESGRSETGGDEGRGRTDRDDRTDRESDDRTGSDRSGGTDRGRSRQERSTADEYRQRHQRNRGRQGRSRNDHRSGGRQSETADSGGSGGAGRSGDSGGASAGGTSSGGSTAETSTASARGSPGWGQPSATGSPLNPDVELLKYPALLVYWWLASAVSPILLTAALLPVYYQYRRMKYTDRILREGTSPEGWETVVRRLAVGVGVVVVATAVLGLEIGGATGEGLSVVALLIGLFLCLRYFKETLVRDWFNAEGTSQPVAWDAASRVTLIALPLLSEAGIGNVGEAVLLFVPPVVATGYLLATDRRSDVRAAIGL
ncbi:DnaJ domain-containing protein [Haloparvum sedimenti]|uniref:DnaJ domain-containing protein n=1 Tax=Haloparvum sedimenti TaxID=1678448 RepID=UPI00071E9275|nr:DnaJ domain-containing protein [Haloparvum sedimenti]